MDETLMLLLLVIVMLVGSYLAGSIPLVVSLSEEKMKVVTIFGAGLLVGTALSVIIPEGIRALYGDCLPNVSTSHHHQQRRDLTMKSNNGDAVAIGIEKTPEQLEHTSTIGISLVLGFVFMLIVDQISSRRTRNESPTDRNSTATIGLVVHAAADGIALGAAATTSHQDIEMIVFLAIMLHKAPAAFGLVSFLLHEGIDRKRIRKHLIVFSLSAPLLTLLTYFGIGAEQKERLNTLNATGIAMLFSAGTFLYVATVHVLPELTAHAASHHSGSGPIYTHLEQQAPTPKGFSGLKNIELLILITGALLPLLLTVGHNH